MSWIRYDLGILLKSLFSSTKKRRGKERQKKRGHIRKIDLYGREAEKITNGIKNLPITGYWSESSPVSQYPEALFHISDQMTTDGWPGGRKKLEAQDLKPWLPKLGCHNNDLIFKSWIIVSLVEWDSYHFSANWLKWAWFKLPTFKNNTVTPSCSVPFHNEVNWTQDFMFALHSSLCCNLLSFN